MPLNIDWQQILLHLFNFVLLFTGLSLLLYAPVRRFMQKRRETFEQSAAEAERQKAELATIDAQCSEKCKQTEADCLAKRAEADAAAAETVQRAQAQARLEADRIIEEAKKSAESIRANAANHAKDDLAALALSMAEAVLQKELTQDCNDKLIEECLAKWEAEE